MKSILLTFLSIITITCFSQKTNIDIDELIAETQISSNESDKIEIIWWIPVEFWEGIFDAEESMTEMQKKEMIKVLKPYSIFAIVVGTIGPFGGVTYTSLEQMEKTVKLNSSNREDYSPISYEELNSDTQILLASMKPVLKNMLGELGENMHFFVFPDLDKKKTRISDPKIPGAVIIEVNDKEYSWKTPLGSLMPPKFCPTCQERMNGAWEYCPWHGQKLVMED